MTWNKKKKMYVYVAKSSLCSTSPSVCGASPPGLELSSAAPRWCRAFFSSCTTRGYPYTMPKCACWCADVGHKTQSPKGMDKREQNRSVWSIYIKLKDEYLWTECDTHRCFLVDGFDDKLLVIERDVSNLTPGESNLWCQSGWNNKKLVNCADF